MFEPAVEFGGVIPKTFEFGRDLIIAEAIVGLLLRQIIRAYAPARRKASAMFRMGTRRRAAASRAWRSSEGEHP